MNRRNIGIIYILLAAFFFALMNLFVRLSGDLPTLQKCFFRNAVAMLVAGILLARNRQRFRPTRTTSGGLLIRSAAGTVGLICNFYAVDHLSISDASLLNKLSPFFAIIFSALLLKERANRVEWAAVATAFCGALFVIKPSLNMSVIPALIGTLGGLGAGLAYTYVRRLGQQGVPSPVIVFVFSAFSCLVTLPSMLFAFSPMTLAQTLFLLLAGAAAAGGQFSITAAYTRAPAKELSVFDYSQIVFAALLGFVFLDQIPDLWSVIGYCIIIGAAVAKWLYNRRAA